MSNGPMIVGPAGLTLQWYMGIGTGLCAAYIVFCLFWR